jgi:hypothetical protein
MILLLEISHQSRHHGHHYQNDKDAECNRHHRKVRDAAFYQIASWNNDLVH